MRPGTGGIARARVTTFQDGPAGWSRKFRRFLSWETENDVGDNKTNQGRPTRHLGQQPESGFLWRGGVRCVNIHFPERLDQVDHRYRQVEDDSDHGQQEAYDAGARLKQPTVAPPLLRPGTGAMLLAGALARFRAIGQRIASSCPVRL